jgi:hypothetical protein
MLKPADKHSEKVSIYINWDRAATPGCVHLIIWHCWAEDPCDVFAPTTAKTRSGERLPKCWLVSPVPAEGCCQY